MKRKITKLTLLVLALHSFALTAANNTAYFWLLKQNNRNQNNIQNASWKMKNQNLNLFSFGADIVDKGLGYNHYFSSFSLYFGKSDTLELKSFVSYHSLANYFSSWNYFETLNYKWNSRFTFQFGLLWQTQSSSIDELSSESSSKNTISNSKYSALLSGFSFKLYNSKNFNFNISESISILKSIENKKQVFTNQLALTIELKRHSLSSYYNYIEEINSFEFSYTYRPSDNLTLSSSYDRQSNAVKAQATFKLSRWKGKIARSFIATGARSSWELQFLSSSDNTGTKRLFRKEANSNLASNKINSKQNTEIKIKKVKAKYNQYKFFSFALLLKWGISPGIALRLMRLKSDPEKLENYIFTLDTNSFEVLSTNLQRIYTKRKKNKAKNKTKAKTKIIVTTN